MPNTKFCHAADFFGNDVQIWPSFAEHQPRALAGSDSQVPHVREMVDKAFSFWGRPYALFLPMHDGLSCIFAQHIGVISLMAALKPDVILLELHISDDCSFNPEFVKANLSGARVLAMSLSGDYASEELLAENFGAVRTLDKAKLCDELIPAILQTET